jgi:hypothetical protein
MSDVSTTGPINTEHATPRGPAAKGAPPPTADQDRSSPPNAVLHIEPLLTIRHSGVKTLAINLAQRYYAAEIDRLKASRARALARAWSYRQRIRDADSASSTTIRQLQERLVLQEQRFKRRIEGWTNTFKALSNGDATTADTLRELSGAATERDSLRDGLAEVRVALQVAGQPSGNLVDRIQALASERDTYKRRALQAEQKLRETEAQLAKATKARSERNA